MPPGRATRMFGDTMFAPITVETLKGIKMIVSENLSPFRLDEELHGSYD